MVRKIRIIIENLKIKETVGINDIETMKEVLYRNYKNKKTNTKLIIVDGGKKSSKCCYRNCTQETWVKLY